MRAHYDRLASATGKVGLTQILDTLLSNQQNVHKQLSEVRGQIRNLESLELLHIQRVGIVRFNPFADTGGSQSFTLALLDGHKNGIVLTSLYARGGGRWYIKQIRQGSGTDVSLSKEEAAAIAGATAVGETALSK